jgi:ABC superfamily ATP binding cassette transporter, ABC protein
MDNRVILSLDNIFKEYQKNKDNRVSVINGISLNIYRGEFLAIVGRSGSGKTTLMQIMSGLLAPSSGQVYYNGENINGLSEKEKAKFRNEKMGFVFQNFFVEKNFTAFENIELPLLLKNYSKEERQQKITKVLELVELEHRKEHTPKEMSGGETQRLCIARALVNEPEIIFADEPTGQLDFSTSQNIMRIFTELKKQDKTIVMVTHNEEDAKKYADRIVRICDGRICEE